MSRVAVVGGAGAVGLSFATMLAAGATKKVSNVTVFARGASLSALQKSGLRLKLEDELITVPVDGERVCATQLQNYNGSSFDIVFLCVKGHSLDTTLLAELKPLFKAPTAEARPTALVCAQNGLPFWYTEGCGGTLEGKRFESLNPTAADALLRETSVVGCVLYLAAWLDDDDETGARTAVMGKRAKKVVCGSPQADDPHLAQASELAVSVLQSAGVNALGTDRIRSVVWDKLVGNSQWNPLSALTLQPLGYLCRGHMVELALSIGREVVAVAEAN